MQIEMITAREQIFAPHTFEKEVADMERRPINPVSWSLNLGFDQAELIERHQAAARLQRTRRGGRRR
jgi:hypothetical protein